jgi:AmiR/NasT family two-component response regulator
LKPHAFSPESEAIGSVLAAHAAAAILASREGEKLQSALISRDLIGQAKGIIMERYGVDAVRAFEMLRKLSQEMNVRLTTIAQRVVDTREDDT